MRRALPSPKVPVAGFASCSDCCWAIRGFTFDELSGSFAVRVREDRYGASDRRLSASERYSIAFFESNFFERCLLSSLEFGLCENQVGPHKACRMHDLSS